MPSELKRIPGGAKYLTCVHVKSRFLPNVVVVGTRHPPNDYFRRLFDFMYAKLPKTELAEYFMVCRDCFDSGDLENGAPYDLRIAHGDIELRGK